MIGSLFGGGCGVIVKVMVGVIVAEGKGVFVKVGLAGVGLDVSVSVGTGASGEFSRRVTDFFGAAHPDSNIKQISKPIVRKYFFI